MLLLSLCALISNVVVRAGSIPEKHHAMAPHKTALILVDIQYDFLPPNGSLAVTNGTEILPIVYDLLDHKRYDAYIATQDYHPEGHVSFASAHPAHAAFTEIQVPLLHSNETTAQMLWPDHCVQNTQGGAIEAGVQDRLTQLEKEGKTVKYVKKGANIAIDSYSGFADNQYSSFTALSQILHTNEITRVVVVGLATDYCVRATAIDSRKFNFTTEVVRAGTRAVDPDNFSKVLEELVSWGCTIV